MANSVGEVAVPKEDTTSDAGGDAQHLPQPSHVSSYEVGERVIASFEGHFYEAKVEKVEFQESWRFFIHYWRWNRSWDEWVGVDRLMKLTKENLQRVLPDKKQVTDVKAGCLSQAKFDSSGKRPRNNTTFKCRKRKREQSTVKGKDGLPVDKFINISVPPTLKKQLMDDFDFINRMGKLVKLPRTPNVDDIIKKYEEYRRKKDIESTFPMEEKVFTKIRMQGKYIFGIFQTPKEIGRDYQLKEISFLPPVLYPVKYFDDF